MHQQHLQYLQCWRKSTLLATVLWEYWWYRLTPTPLWREIRLGAKEGSFALPVSGRRELAFSSLLLIEFRRHFCLGLPVVDQLPAASTQAPPRLEPESHWLTTPVVAANIAPHLFPPLLTAASPADMPATGEHSTPLGAAWFAALPSWDMWEEEGQWWAYIQRLSSSRT